jgi:hypothetical protein
MYTSWNFNEMSVESLEVPHKMDFRCVLCSNSCIDHEVSGVVRSDSLYSYTNFKRKLFNDGERKLSSNLQETYVAREMADGLVAV